MIEWPVVWEQIVAERAATIACSYQDDPVDITISQPICVPKFAGDNQIIAGAEGVRRDIEQGRAAIDHWEFMVVFVPFALRSEGLGLCSEVCTVVLYDWPPTDEPLETDEGLAELFESLLGPLERMIREIIGIQPG